MDLPGAIIFINAELNDTTISGLQEQLRLTEVISFQEFNSRISALPSYHEIVHFQNLRVLVIQESIINQTNEEFADIVLYFHQGMIDVQKTKFGPPGLSLPAYKINIYELLRNVKSPEVTVLPSCSTSNHCDSYTNHCNCSYNCHASCHCPFNCHGIGGIFSINSRDPSGVHCPNPDNVFHNKDFLNRK
jgi:hypothetical protein